MGLIFSNFGTAVGIFKKDKMIILLAMVPILVGLVLFSLFGTWIFEVLLDDMKVWVEQTVNLEGWGSFFSYIIIGILSVALYFITSWTFVLLVSLIASPFNDIISSRAERVIGGQAPESISLSFSNMFKNISKIIFNEIKKIAFILFMTTMAFVISFIPMLAPISVVLSAILMAVSFLDYTWSRHELPFRECIGDVKKSFIHYGLSGAIFLALITIPVFNLFLLPFGVVYFTILFHQRGSKA
jgi:CysZ protein